MNSYTDTVHDELLGLVRGALNGMVDNVDQYRLDVVRAPTIVIITVYADSSAVSRLVGRGGATADAMRLLCRNWWAKYKMRVEYNVNEDKPE